MNQRKAGALLSYVSIIVSNSVSLIYTPYMLRMLGQSEYGIFSTASSFVAYLSLLNFGIGGAYIRFNARYRAANDHEGEKRLNGMFLIVFSFLSAIAFAGGMLLIALVKPLTKNTFSNEEVYKLRVIIFILTINTVFTFVFNVVMMALYAYEKFIFLRVILLMAGILQPILNVIILKQGGKSISLSVATFSISALSYIAYYVYARKKISLQFSFCQLNWTEMKEIFIFSSFLFIDMISNQITSSTDQVILSAVKGTVAVAIYNVGRSFCMYFNSFSSVVSSVFAARINMLVAQKKPIAELEEIFIKVGRIQFYVVSLILIGYSFIGHKFIMIWAGADYSDSYWIGLLLMLSSFIPCIQNVGVEIQKALNKHKVRSLVYLAVAVVNIIITIPLSKVWSGAGAAFATLLCVLLGQVIFMNWYYYVKINLNIFRFWKSIISILPGFIPSITVAFVINNIIGIKSLWGILIAALVITGTYCISVWFLSMNSYERNLFGNMLKKIINKMCRR